MYDTYHMVCKERRDIWDPACPSRAVLDLIADKWTVIIIYALADGTLRYRQLQDKVGGITQKVLTSTLRQLERDGLIARKVYPVVPPKVEYSLTKLGGTLVDMLVMLTKWSERHLPEVKEAQKQYDDRRT